MSLFVKKLIKFQLFGTLPLRNISFRSAQEEELTVITIWILLYYDFVYQWEDYHFHGNLQNSDYSNTNNQVWEVLAHVAHTWDPGGFDAGGEGGEVLIGFLRALLPTFHPHTFRHSSASSSPLQFLYAEQPKLQFDETHLFDLTLASPSQLKSRRPFGVMWPNSNWVNERIYVQVWDLTGGAVFHLGLVCSCY